MKKMPALLAIILTVAILPITGCAGTVGTVTSANVASGRPWPTKDWSVSAPEAQGISSSALAKADQDIKDHYPNVYSLLVVRHGCLVYEKYYNGMGRDNDNQIYSVTKSVLSALTGIAIEQKLIAGVDQPVADLLPDYFAGIGDAAKKQITVKNVLTMSGGLESIDNDYDPFFSSSDWLAYTLGRPMVDKPGTKFVYNTGLTQCLSDVISKTSGMDTKQFAQKNLFSALGISIKTWRSDSTGHFGGGTGLFLTPRDLAKLGYLYLNNGQWDGKQIVPQEWVAESTHKHIQANDIMDYGYLFWLQTVHDAAHNTDYFTYRADGAGGQKIVVVPQLDLVAVVTADINTATKNTETTEKIVYTNIIPGVIN